MKPLTLVYLMAAAAASSSVFIGASATNICTNSTLPDSYTFVDGGSYEASGCSQEDSTSFNFRGNLTSAATLTVTGAGDVSYENSLSVGVSAESPVHITFRGVTLASDAYLEFYGTPAAGSTIVVTNCRFESSASWPVDFYFSTLVRSTVSFLNNVFVTEYDQTAMGIYPAEDGQFNSTSFTFRNNTYDGEGRAYIDVTYFGGVGNTVVFDKNTLLNGADLELYNYGTKNTFTVTGNTLTNSIFYLEHDGDSCVSTVSRNTFNNFWSHHYVEADTSGLSFTDNTYVCPDSGMWLGLYLSGIDDNTKASFSRNTFAEGCDANLTVYLNLPMNFPSGADIAFDENTFTIGSEIPSPFLLISQKEFYAHYGPASLSVSGNDFRFANGIKPQHLVENNVPLIDFAENSPKVRQMKQQSAEKEKEEGSKKTKRMNAGRGAGERRQKKQRGGKKAPKNDQSPASRAMEAASGNDMKLKLKDNVVDGTVITSAAQLSVFLSNFNSLQNSVGSGLDFSQTAHSGASPNANGIIVGAILAAVVAMLTVA